MMEAKRKGISTVGKYEFDYNSESKIKSSFVFVANDKDTLLVHTDDALAEQ